MKGFQGTPSRAFQSPGFQQESGDGGQQGGSFRARRGYRFVPTPDTKRNRIRRENELAVIL